MVLGSLPTDNLYKFIALGGLTMLLFGADFPWSTMADTWKRIDEVQVELAVLEVQSR